MKILSVDVGIKNLAMCIIEWNESNNLIIHYWDTINLLDNTEDLSLKCMYNNCQLKIKSYIEYKNIKYYICSKHIINKNDLVDKIINDDKEINWLQTKENICEICINKQIEKTKKIFFCNNITNKILCNKHYKILQHDIGNALNKVSLIKQQKIKNIMIDNIKLLLINNLDNNKNILLNIDEVYIENQPSLKNPTMKAIADTIYSWFLIRGIIDKNINNSTINKIKFISPINKLKEFKDNSEINSTENLTESKKYRETKKLAIENTKKILTSYNLIEKLNFLLLHNKKDDLADSFLQGWYVLNNNFNNLLFNNWKELNEKN